MMVNSQTVLQATTVIQVQSNDCRIQFQSFFTYMYAIIN